MALLADDELSALQVQMAHTAAKASQPSYPLAPTVAPKEPTWNDAGGGYYDDGLGHYSNNGGVSWDYTPPPAAPAPTPEGSFRVGSAADRAGYETMPTVAIAPEQAVAVSDWMGTSNAGRAGSQYDRMGFQEAPTNRDLVDYYQNQAERDAALGNVMGFAGKAAGGLNFTSPEQSAWNRQEEDPTGWGGQPKNAYANLPEQYAAGNADPSTGIGKAFSYANSGNAIVRSLGGPDLDKLPYGLGYVTDAINPVTLATIAAGPSVPVLGSAFGGGLAKRAAGEVAVNAAGMVAGAKSAEKAAEYTDNPWLVGGAGLLGGLAGAGGVLGAVGAAKRAPGVVKAADRALTGLDAKIMEPAGSFGNVATAEPMVFSKGLKKGAPERTVIPDSRTNYIPDIEERPFGNKGSVEFRDRNTGKQIAVVDSPEVIAGRGGTSPLWHQSGGYAKGATKEDVLNQVLADLRNSDPAPLANDRLWFHSTRDMTYDLPDPDLAVGTQTGITQGPGIYMAADPKKSAGNYGPRTFVAEFDGKTLDLTRQMDEVTPVFDGGPTWTQIRDTLADKLDAAGMDSTPVRTAYNPKAMDAAQYKAVADNAAVVRNPDGTYSANGYVYKQSLLDALRGAIGDQNLTGLPESAQRALYDLKGRFMSVVDMRRMPDAIVQNHLADSGVDALFHHSPRADGDVLIVLNGEKARVVADVKNAPEAVKQGATLKDIKRGAVAKVVRDTQGAKSLEIEDFGDRFRLYDRNRNIVGLASQNEDGTWFGRRYVGFSRQTEDTAEMASRADIEKWIREGEQTGLEMRKTSIRTFGSRINDETGALDMGAVADVARAAKPYLAPVAREAGRVAGHAAVGAGVGAATGAYASDGDLGATLRGAAIGAAGGVTLRGVGGIAGKAASTGVAQKAATRNAALGVPDAPPATAKLIEIIKAAKPARASAEELKSQALRTKAAKLHGVYGSNTGEAAFSRAPSALGGDLPKGQFDAPRPSFTQEDVDSLFNHIAANPLVAGKNKERVFTVFNTQGALFKALAGELPTNGEIQLLEKAFGPELAKALLGKRSLGAKAMSAALDAINVPRSLITAIDASAPLRQGALLVPGHPIVSIKAAGTMARAMASQEYAKYVDEGIAASPNMPTYEKMGLYFAPNSATSPISAREEGIASRLAGKLPGVGGSQRGYTTYLNKVRQDLADNWIKTLSPTELKDDTMLRQMGDWLNVASGRGKLPPAADRIVSVSSGAFFAPRYAISRIQVPIEAVRAVNPLSGMKGDVRKEIARDLVAFVGTGVSVLALGKAAGFWEAELDPRSTDFGKIRIGPTRLDMWAGEQQIARTVAQLASGQRKSTSTGDIIPTDRSDTMLRWLRSKASPAASAAWDLGEGKTFIGEELNADKPTIGKQAFQRLMPLFIQGVTEAWMEDGWKAGARAGVGATGIGVQTYFTNRDVQNRVAGEMFGKTYLDLTKGERDLVKADPRMVEQAAAFSDSAKVDPSQFFDRKDEFYGQLEADFRTKVEAGMEGKALKDAVSDLKGDRWTASQALLGSEAVQKVLKSGTPNSQIIDALAESYWSAPVTEDPKTGELDFASRDAERAKIVQQVKDLGLDMNYITGTGLGTFRGERFTDPVVREAVLKVEAQTEMLETSGYWSLKDDAWAKIQAAKMPGIAGYEDYYAWRDAMQTKVAGQIEAAGESKEYAMEEAVRLVAKMDPAKVQSDILKVTTSKWVLAHPEAAVTAWRLGYFNPGKENGQEVFLNDWIKKHPEFK